MTLQAETAAVQLELQRSQHAQEDLRQQLTSTGTELKASQAAQQTSFTSLNAVKVDAPFLYAALHLQYSADVSVQDRLRLQAEADCPEVWLQNLCIVHQYHGHIVYTGLVCTG